MVKLRNIKVAMRGKFWLMKMVKIQFISTIDTSGPYTDPSIEINIKRFQKIREKWILDRQDISFADKFSSSFTNVQREKKSLFLLSSSIEKPIFVGKDKKNVTQMVLYENGIITPEMEYVAIRRTKK